MSKEKIDKANKPAQDAMILHPFYKGKIEVVPKCRVKSLDDFSIWYTPGVAAPCKAIEKDKELAYEYTEDVTFGLLGAWFWSGDYYTVPEHAPQNIITGETDPVAKGKSVASEVVATCKVTF